MFHQQLQMPLLSHLGSWSGSGLWLCDLGKEELHYQGSAHIPHQYESFSATYAQSHKFSLLSPHKQTPSHTADAQADLGSSGRLNTEELKGDLTPQHPLGWSHFPAGHALLPSPHLTSTLMLLSRRLESDFTFRICLDAAKPFPTALYPSPLSCSWTAQQRM